MRRKKKDGRNPPFELGRLLRGERLVEPPAAVVSKALALGSALPRKTEGVAAWLVECLFDSAALPAPAGVRGAAAGQRRLLYEARGREGTGTRQLDLRLRIEDRGTLEITGQLLPPPAEGSVTLRATGGRERRVRMRDTGEFVLRGVKRRAPLSLEIDTGDDPPIRIGNVRGPRDEDATE